jgi:hypothetical protein
VRAIEERVALHTMAPVSHQEDVQVLRYGVGQVSLKLCAYITTSLLCAKQRNVVLLVSTHKV